MARALPDIKINSERLIRDFNTVSRIGIGEHGSVTRLVFSVKELRARQLLIHLMHQAGLEIQIDRIGNIFPDHRKTPLTDITEGVMTPKRISMDVSEAIDICQRDTGAIPPLTLKETENRLRPRRVGTSHLQVGVDAIGIVIAGGHIDLYATAVKIDNPLHEIIERTPLFLR